MGLNDGLPAGATPLDGEELDGLLPTHLVSRKMFGESWRCAGQYRSSDKRIGVDWWQIRMQVSALLADIAFQMEHQVEAVDHIASSDLLAFARAS